jgi:hypothetical protein
MRSAMAKMSSVVSGVARLRMRSSTRASAVVWGGIGWFIVWSSSAS